MPYQCQLAGWGLLGAAVIFLLLYITGCLEPPKPQENTGVHYLILQLLFYPSIFLISLSREKDEDEMVHELRVSSVAIAAYVMMIFFVIIQIATAFGFAYSCSHPTSDMRLYALQHLTSNILFGFCIYLAIYKIRLWKCRWETRKSMEA